jgi:hypothetical protein
MVHTMRHLGCVSLNWELSGMGEEIGTSGDARRPGRYGSGLVRVFSPACMEGMGYIFFLQRRSRR